MDAHVPQCASLGRLIPLRYKKAAKAAFFIARYFNGKAKNDEKKALSERLFMKVVRSYLVPEISTSTRRLARRQSIRLAPRWPSQDLAGAFSPM